MKINRVLVLLFIVLVGLLFWLNAKNDVLVGDEIVYTYVLDHDRYGDYWQADPETPHIQTIGDVVSSQYDHWKFWHGRNIVMAVEQFFSGVSTPAAFFVVNSFVFLMLLVSVVFLCMGRGRWYLLYPWLIAALCLLYLFPAVPTLWNSICLGVNYLWPSVFIMCTLLLLRYVRTHNNLGWGWFLVCIAVGFVSGWSHEAFCVPVSGAFVIYYLFYLNELRGKQLALVISFWVGTLVLLAAPGNLVRLSGGSGEVNIFSRTLNALNLLFQTKMFWILIISSVIYYISDRKSSLSYFKANKFYFLLWGLSIFFVMFANTGVHTCTFIELMSLVLWMIMLAPLFVRVDTYACARWIWTGIVILFTVHQSYIIAAEWDECAAIRETIKEYVESDKVLELKSREISPLVRPWVKTWEGMSAGIGASLNVKSFERYYTRSRKPFVALGSEDYKVVSCPGEYFTEANRVNDDTNFYTTPGSAAYWMRSDTVVTDRYELVLAPVSFGDKVPLMMKFKRMLRPGEYPNSMPVDTLQCIELDSVRLYYIPKGGLRTAVGVRRVVD